MLAKVVCGASLIRSLSLCCAALSAARSLPGARLSATGLSDELDSASERRQSELGEKSTVAAVSGGGQAAAEVLGAPTYCRWEFLVPCSSSTACLFPDDVLHEANICFSSLPLAECEGLLGMPTSTNVSEPETNTLSLSL